MSIKKYEYKNIEGVNTLRLPIDMAKLDLITNVREASYILSTKGRKKSAYITRAIRNYEDKSCEGLPVSKALQRFRIANKAKEMFNIASEDRAREILSISPGSKKYEEIVESIPEPIEPRKMLLGFKANNPEAQRIHKELFNKSANERILTISNAVVDYALNGNDPDMEAIFATRYIISTIGEYNRRTDKNRVISDFMTTINYIS